MVFPKRKRDCCGLPLRTIVLIIAYIGINNGKFYQVCVEAINTLHFGGVIQYIQYLHYHSKEVAPSDNPIINATTSQNETNGEDYDRIMNATNPVSFSFPCWNSVFLLVGVYTETPFLLLLVVYLQLVYASVIYILVALYCFFADRFLTLFIWTLNFLCSYFVLWLIHSYAQEVKEKRTIPVSIA